MQPIEDHQRLAAHHLEAAGPARTGQSGAHGLLRQLVPGGGPGVLGGQHGGGGVLHLVRAEQRQRQAAIGAERGAQVERGAIQVLLRDADGALVRDVVVCGADLRRAGANHVERRLAHRRGDEVARADQDAGLLRGDRRDRVAEDFGVFEVDRGDHRDVFAGHRVRGVQPPAEADLHHLPVAAGVRAGHPAQQRQRLEVGEAGDAIEAEQPLGERGEAVVRQGRAVDGDALTGLVHVGRGEQEGVHPRRAQDRLGEHGDRAFALRPGDVHGAPRLRVAEVLQQFRDVRDAEAPRVVRVAGALVPAVVEQTAHRLDVCAHRRELGRSLGGHAGSVGDGARWWRRRGGWGGPPVAVWAFESRAMLEPLTSRSVRSTSSQAPSLECFAIPHWKQARHEALPQVGHTDLM